jgi:hypothetical protein
MAERDPALTGGLRDFAYCKILIRRESRGNASRLFSRDIAKEHPEHPAHPHSDVNQLASFNFADEGSADSGHLAHPHFDNAKVPGTVMSDAASEQFVFEKGHDKVADVKLDMIETDHAVADIRHLLHTAHDANAVGALDSNHTTAPQDMTKVQLPHHHGDFHFA